MPLTNDEGGTCGPPVFPRLYLPELDLDFVRDELPFTELPVRLNGCPVTVLWQHESGWPVSHPRFPLRRH